MAEYQLASMTKCLGLISCYSGQVFCHEHYVAAATLSVKV